ncbi:MAG: M56 family metallopeptidase [Phycisphaerales bacterium]|nr:M56 family metallopeptidase [Phycisphaerales bacterium]
MNELFDDRLNTLVHALAWSLLHFLWQGAALASACGLAMIAARRCSARTRYVIGCATLCAMALAPVVTLTWLLSKPTGASASPPSTLCAVALGGAAQAPPSVNSALLIIVVIWALGCAACTLCLFGGWAQARRLRRLPDCGLPAGCRNVVARISTAMHVRASVRVVESAAVAVPMTMGWLAPVVLLPASLLTGLPAKQLEAIIAHELAHIRRFDYLVNLIQLIIESILFYHPAVWWVSRRVRLEREYCCDDLAVLACGDRVLYVRALTELETLRSASADVRLGLSSNGGSLMKRIVRLIDGHSSRQTVPARLPATLAGCALLASASAALAFMNAPTVSDRDAVTEVQEQQVITFSGMVAPAACELTQTNAEAESLLILQVIADASIQLDPSLEPMPLRSVGATLMAANSSDQGEMPSEELLSAARQLYPFNLFELMPWISPSAHDLIKPADADLILSSTFVHRSLPTLVAQGVLLSGGRIELAGEVVRTVEIAVELPLELRIEETNGIVVDGEPVDDERLADDEVIVEGEAVEEVEEELEP